MAQRSIVRPAHEALSDIRDAERRWDGWNSDAVKAVNALVNVLLQHHAAQQPAAWHPSLLFLFPDLVAKFEAANLHSARDALARLRTVVDKMAQHVSNIDAAADKLATLVPLVSQAAGTQPFAFGTLEMYARLARAACETYKKAMTVREEHISQLDATIRALEGASAAPLLPPGSLDSDAQLVKILTWQDSPGLKDARLDHPDHTTILTLADFDDLLLLESQV
ncbi:hypothetical protein LPJ61_005703 [Coemansia biformis]|uniref:Uncharacterized protein n=1 Tax=Coemansia biformis TaxID=1286918 RepID=A0A9W7Y7F8_9FUNG|nr:hypothetical protein LPJ61_005703 [Coemansia biformis]